MLDLATDKGFRDHAPGHYQASTRVAERRPRALPAGRPRDPLRTRSAAHRSDARLSGLGLPSMGPGTSQVEGLCRGVALVRLYSSYLKLERRPVLLLRHSCLLVERLRISKL